MSLFVAEDAYRTGLFEPEMTAVVESVLLALSTTCRALLAQTDRDFDFASRSEGLKHFEDNFLPRQQELIKVPEKIEQLSSQHAPGLEAAQYGFLLPLTRYCVTICDASTPIHLAALFAFCAVLMGRAPVSREALFAAPFELHTFAPVRYNSLIRNQELLTALVEWLRAIWGLGLDRFTARDLINRLQALTFNEDLYNATLYTRVVIMQFEERDRFKIK